MEKNGSGLEEDPPHLQTDDVGLFESVQAYLALERGSTVPVELARAWERFFRVFNTEIIRSARRIQPSRAECEDSIQDVWVAILVQFPRFRYRPQKGKPFAWLRVLVRRVLFRCRRRAAHRQTAQLPDQEELNIRGEEADPAEAYERGRDSGLLVKALRELRECASRLSYEALYLHDVNELNTDEVAARLGLTSKQVRGRIARMRAKLRRILVRLRTC